MDAVLVDSNVILDVFESDPHWLEWSTTVLERLSASHRLVINPVIYAEVSIGFVHIEELEDALRAGRFVLEETPREALFLAGKAFLAYRRRRGPRASPLPDFFIGAHAAVRGLPLLTRDSTRYRSYFPRVRVIDPTTSGA